MGLSVQIAVGHALIFKGWQVSGWAEVGGERIPGRAVDLRNYLCSAGQGEGRTCLVRADRVFAVAEGARDS